MSNDDHLASSPLPVSRRRFLVLAGSAVLAAVAAACTGDKKQTPTPSSVPSGSIGELQQGAAQLSLLAGLGNAPQDAIQTGRSVYTFDLSAGGGSLITGGTPQVYAAPGETAQAIGPFPATWHPFTGYQATGDHSPKSPLPGVYVADIKIPAAGLWTFAGVAEAGGRRGVGVSHAYVADDVVAAVGSKATSVKTPVATTEAGLKKICTRNPPDPMHSISLDKALTNGKPTVVSFATPLLCQSQLCGPVVDEQLLVYRKVGAKKANFIHVEEFPQRDASKPAPAFVAWKFQTEPWVIVIDRKGIIRARFEGPITAPQIEEALAPLL